MSFPVALDAKHILLPVNLFQQDGSRMSGPLPGLGAVSAMVVGLTGEDVVFQEMHPLRLRDRATDVFDGNGWELRSLPVGAGYHAYYLGIPDSLFASQPEGDIKIKALSLEVIGSSNLGRTVGFNGGVDIHLEAEMSIPAPVALIQLMERFYPDLWQGLEGSELELVSDPSDGSWVLWIPTRSHSFRTPPPAQSPHFHPRMHQGAAIEGLGNPNTPLGYWIIRAGCFREAGGRLGHWFGQRFGPIGWAFRRTANTLANAYPQRTSSGWFLWLQPIGLPEYAIPEWLGPPAIRHSALHQALSRGFPGQSEKNRGPGEVNQALRALEELARIWHRHRAAILAWRSAPAGSEWLLTEENQSPPSEQGQELLHIAQEFISTHADGLRVLERLQEEEWESSALRHPVDRLLTSLAPKTQRSTSPGP